MDARRFSWCRGATLAAIAVAVCWLVAWRPNDAAARPRYMMVFQQEYPEYGKVRCAFCHPARDRKWHTPYSFALRNELGVRNVKDVEEIRRAMREIEDQLP